MHMRRVGHRDHILRQSKAGSHAVIVVVGRDEKHVVPNFVLPNLMLDRFPREYQTDASAILYVQAMMIAVVILKLRLAPPRISHAIPRSLLFSKCPGKIDARPIFQ